MAEAINEDLVEKTFNNELTDDEYREFFGISWRAVKMYIDEAKNNKNGDIRENIQKIMKIVQDSK